MFSNLFNFHAIHEHEHGHSTKGGIEYGGCGEDKKGEDSFTSTRRINGLWRCPLIDINMSE